MSQVLRLTSLFMLLFSVLACQGKNSTSSSSIPGVKKIHFGYDSAVIPQNMLSNLDSNASYLKKHSNLNVVVEGHCDERGTNEYNLALGDRRATATKRYLVNRGISSNRMRTVSYGEEKPVNSAQNESAWYLNRRAEFVRQ